MEAIRDLKDLCVDNIKHIVGQLSITAGKHWREKRTELGRDVSRIRFRDYFKTSTAYGQWWTPPFTVRPPAVKMLTTHKVIYPLKIYERRKKVDIIIVNGTNEDENSDRGDIW